ncbi:hypothetical protein HS088_TW12G00620 [Tripterygium wilfordii]|uniref:RBR-type E3 ubiquitin transferase n=1 Tax=Tripterygium wilfordii TaxID=458696 RepID=A0A7J7CZ68_TRIWF|nr:probable E3 ubiquitin-protein ligase ARI8 [Tripterygium wilfordii]KAF5739415.1 hypothetical protein HS088_TW12G00620 [Tripterygium wilfordii]
MENYSDYSDSDPDANDEPELLEADERSVNREDRKPYRILKESEIRLRMEDDIKVVSAVLSVSEVDASIILRTYNWSVNRVNDAWFSDEYAVRGRVGLLGNRVPVDRFASKFVDCGICFESCRRDRIKSAACGHPYCCECWSGYIGACVDNGPGCLTMKCPEPSCSAAVGDDMINALASEEGKGKYYNYLFRSYIENSKTRKWCPAPNCEYAFDFVGGDGGSEITCLCAHKFCWNCNHNAHRPVDCETVVQWVAKSGAENVNWVLVHTKPCPKCKRNIEKNMGCMHMTCRPPCNHQFCWVCMKDWHNHGNCNRYEDKKDTQLREEAKKELEKYNHYYERYSANEVSQRKATESMKEVETKHIVTLSDVQGEPETRLNFLIDAWKQIIECRRVLKWTYAYGYYLPAHQRPMKQLFEYLQGEAESGLERLHSCAEREVQQFIDTDQRSEEFIPFRVKLIGLTEVTRNFFENLVRAIEDGLSDVTSEGACSSVVSSQGAGEESKRHRTTALDGCSRSAGRGSKRRK